MNDQTAAIYYLRKVFKVLMSEGYDRKISFNFNYHLARGFKPPS